MSPEDSSLEQAARSKNVSLSKWVNEPLPAWEQLLSAHDVARLTRRPRWVLLSSMLMGQFPRMQRFHGRRIGWLRADVLDWRAAKNVRVGGCHVVPQIRRRFARQMSLPLESARVCSVLRVRTP